MEKVLIATDDERIGKACDEFGADWRMTSPAHPSGTDRIAEVAAEIDAEIIVNVQGDEPDIDPENIDALVELLETDEQADMATLTAIFGPSEDVSNPNVVKAVVAGNGHALYFSRWPIPFGRDAGGVDNGSVIYRKHLGIYAYRREALLKLSRMEPTPLEQAEKLEQLRALENGLIIATRDVEHEAVGIDTPEQYAEFVERYQKQ